MAFIKIYIRHVWYSSLEYTESDKADSWVPILEFGINIPKDSEIIIFGFFLESIFQIQILEIRSPKVKFCRNLSNTEISQLQKTHYKSPCNWKKSSVSSMTSAEEGQPPSNELEEWQDTHPLSPLRWGTTLLTR